MRLTIVALLLLAAPAGADRLHGKIAPFDRFVTALNEEKYETAERLLVGEVDASDTRVPQLMSYYASNGRCAQLDWLLGRPELRPAPDQLGTLFRASLEQAGENGNQLCAVDALLKANPPINEAGFSAAKAMAAKLRESPFAAQASALQRQAAKLHHEQFSDDHD